MKTETKTSEERIAEAKEAIETARQEWLNCRPKTALDRDSRIDLYDRYNELRRELYAILAEEGKLLRVRETGYRRFKLSFTLDAIGFTAAAGMPKKPENRISYGRFSTLDAALAAKWEIESAEENRLRGYDRD
jgi:hypothetical protein